MVTGISRGTEAVRNDLKVFNLNNKIVIDQINWKLKVHVDDFS